MQIKFEVKIKNTFSDQIITIQVRITNQILTADEIIIKILHTEIILIMTITIEEILLLTSKRILIEPKLEELQL